MKPDKDVLLYMIYYHLSGAPSKDTPEWVGMHQEELGFDRSGIDEKNVNSVNQYLKGCNDYVESLSQTLILRPWKWTYM